MFSSGASGSRTGSVLDADLQRRRVGDGPVQQHAEGVAGVTHAHLVELAAPVFGLATGDHLALVQDFVAQALGRVGLVPGPAGEVVRAALVYVADDAERDGLGAAGGERRGVFQGVFQGAADGGADEDAVALGRIQRRVEQGEEAVRAPTPMAVQHLAGLVGDAAGQDALAHVAGQDDLVWDEGRRVVAVAQPAADVVGAALVQVALMKGSGRTAQAGRRAVRARGRAGGG